MQPRIEVRQESHQAIVDFHPTGDAFSRYSVGKFFNWETRKVEPAKLLTGGYGSWIEATEALTFAGCITMMVNLALQLDRMIQAIDDFERKIVVEQVGLQLIARFEELTNE